VRYKSPEKNDLAHLPKNLKQQLEIASDREIDYFIPLPEKTIIRTLRGKIHEINISYELLRHAIAK
jgi:hypothetical protein